MQKTQHELSISRETCFMYSNSSRRAKLSQHKNIGSAQECFSLFKNNLRFCVESFLYSFQCFPRSVLFLAQLSLLVFTFINVIQTVN